MLDKNLLYKDKLIEKFNKLKQLTENETNLKLKIKAIYTYNLQIQVIYNKNNYLLHLYYKPKNDTYSLKYHNIKDNNIIKTFIQLWDKIENKKTFYDINIYVDGSFYKNEIKWAYLVVNKGKILHKEKGILQTYKEEIKSLRNIAAEILAIKKAILWCKENNIKNINIFYDYIGLEKWAKNLWKAKNSFTKEYKDFIQNIDITINWHKVKSHTGNYFNESVDKLARKIL